MKDTKRHDEINKITLLYVDDEEGLLELGKLFLERTGEFVVDTLTSALEAMNLDHIPSYDAIVSDYQMPEMDGIAFLKAFREKYNDIPFILFTGRGREEVVIEAINNGADSYIQKGGDPKSQFAELSHKIKQSVAKKRAEQLHQQSEKQLSDIIEFLPDATFVIDRSGKVIAWNRAISEMTGVSSEEMLGKGDYEYAIPLYGNRRPLLIDLIFEPIEKITEFYLDVFRIGDSLTGKTDLLIPQGKRIWAFGKACPLYNQDGEIIGAIESIRDITELHKTGDELREKEKKFRTLVEYSRDCILIVGFNGTIHFINTPGLLMVDEGEKEAVIGKKNVLEYVHPDSTQVVLYDMNQVAQGVDGYISSYKIITRKNREIWVESQGIQIPYQNTKAILVSLRDITERKQVEEAWKKSEEQFRALTEQSPDIIVRVDPEYRVRYCNPRITDYIGIKPEDMIGTDARKFQGNEKIVGAWVTLVEQVFKARTAAHDEWKIEPNHWFYGLFYPEFGPDNTIQAVISSIRDISQYKQNEIEREIFYKKLVSHKEFTDALMDAIPIPVYWKDMNQRYLGCNQAFAEIMGIPKGEIIGARYQDILPEITADNIAYHEKELIATGYLPPYHAKFTNRKGKPHEIISSKNLFYDYDGNISGIVGSIQDITEYNRLIHNLKTREELFRMIITQSTDFFIIITPQMDVSFISPNAELISGILTEDVNGKAEQFVHPEDFPRVAHQLERLMQNPYSLEVAEFRTITRDGSYILLEGTAINCIDNPVIKGILITARNITSQRKTESELSKKMRLFQKVLDSSPAYIAILDPEGTVLFANDACSVHSGRPEFPNGTVSIIDFFSSEWKEKSEKILAEVIQTNTPVVQEFESTGKWGNIILSSIFFPIHEGDTILIGFIGLDITEKKDLLIKLDESLVQNAILERLVKERTEEVSDLLDLKDSLITGIAHELRTPLTPLIVLLPMLIDENDSDRRMEMIRVLEKNVSKIADIVEKILHLAQLGIMYKIEEIEEVHILTIVETLLNIYAIAAKKKEISFQIDIPSHLTLPTSKAHLVSVLDNVISNAVKYSKPQGAITISAEKLNGDIRIHIIDDGIGMTREELNRIFEPFFKGDPSRHDRSSPGLGLSVTKRFIQAIGGSIDINSKGRDQGTEVVLTFKKLKEGTFN